MTRALSLLLAGVAALCVSTHGAAAASSKEFYTLPVNNTGATPVYTAAKAFPTSDFASMYFMPTGQEAEPRPVITDVHGKSFPDALNDPAHMTTTAPSATGVLPLPSPSAHASNQLPDQIHEQVAQTLRNSSMSKCDRCKQSLRLGQQLAQAMPDAVPSQLISLCKEFQYERYGHSPDTNRTCELSYTRGGEGGAFTQLLSYADLSDDSTGADYICSQLFYGFCPVPAPRTLSDDFLDTWFQGQREASQDVATRSKKVGTPSNDTLKVLWTSDIHLDGRYAVGAEAECTYGYCCHSNSFNSSVFAHHGYLTNGTTVPPANISTAAPYWGYEGCDAPWSLVASAFETMKQLGGEQGYDLALYTGDLVNHGETWDESEDLVKYAESALYDMMRRYLGNTTVITAIGNHDSYPTELAAPHSLPDNRSAQFSWDWDYVSALWAKEGWLSDQEANMVRTHYGGYSIRPRQGLRLISFNADFWYTGNMFNFINTSHPDVSGVLRFVTDELQAAEEANERAWVMAHVLPGWDGYSTMDLPTNLFYQIVTRYQHTIAHMFFGHSHEDTFSVYFHSTNGNVTSVARNTSNAVGISSFSPSVTPLTNMNPGIRVVEIDPETYEMMDYHQYYTPLQDVQNATETDHGLVWYKLYSARATYSNFSAAQAAGTYAAPVALDDGQWPASAPLNASFWASVADEVEVRPALATLFNHFQGRNSPMSPPCEGQACATAKACFMRAGSYALGKACGSKYSTVQ